MIFLWSLLFFVFIYYILNILTIISPQQIFVISHSWGKEFRNYWPLVLESEDDKDSYECGMERLLAYGFNEAWMKTSARYLKVGYKSMSVICFWDTSRGNLTHFSYIFWNLEPPRKYFNTATFSVTGAMILLDMQRLM